VVLVSKVMLANVATFPLLDPSSWHPFARHDSSFTLARGRGCTARGVLQRRHGEEDGEKEWHLMHVTPACLDAFHWST